MKTTLILTSPTVKGPLVTLTQQLLVNAGYSPGVVDGEYGPATAAAVRRAKFALGYPDKDINDMAGDALRSYLKGKPLPILYAQRAKSRGAQTTGLGNRALTIAKGYLGYTEAPPGSNRNQFGKWYGADGWPWCAEFVTYCLSKAGFKQVSPHDARWAYCPYVVRDARAGHFGLSVLPWAKVSSALDIGQCVLALYDWDDDGVADHIGFVEDVRTVSTFDAIEGNTSVGNNSNGGQVMRRARSISDVQVFVKVG